MSNIGDKFLFDLDLSYLSHPNNPSVILESNIDICDSKISKYNTKLINYSNKIDCVKDKLETIILKKKDYLNNLQLLESIPTLQLGILENSDKLITNDDYIHVNKENNEEINKDNYIQDNISEIYSDTFSNDLNKNNE
jgi:hypothetical protein